MFAGDGCEDTHTAWGVDALRLVRGEHPYDRARPEVESLSDDKRKIRSEKGRDSSNEEPRTSGAQSEDADEVQERFLIELLERLKAERDKQKG